MIGYRAPAVQKAFMLLEAVAKADEGIGISEISDGLGFSKGTTHGLIKALLEVGALDQSPYRKKLFLGASLGELARKARNYYGVTEQAQPILDGLGKDIGEMVFLLVLNRTKGTIIAMSRETRSLGISSSPGATVPVLSGAVGKAFLASLKKGEALKIIREIGLTAYTPWSIVDEGNYLKQLESVKHQGFAIDDEEYVEGIRSLAVNLGNCRGLPLVVWVVGFTSSLTSAKLSMMVQKTREAAVTLAQMSLVNRGLKKERRS